MNGSPNRCTIRSGSKPFFIDWEIGTFWRKFDTTGYHIAVPRHPYYIWLSASGVENTELNASLHFFMTFLSSLNCFIRSSLFFICSTIFIYRTVSGVLLYSNIFAYSYCHNLEYFSKLIWLKTTQRCVIVLQTSECSRFSKCAHYFEWKSLIIP